MNRSESRGADRAAGSSRAARSHRRRIPAAERQASLLSARSASPRFQNATRQLAALQNATRQLAAFQNATRQLAAFQNATRQLASGRRTFRASIHSLAL